MKGNKNGVIAKIREKSPGVIDVGCICHLANLCCKAAFKNFPLCVDDLLVDIYFHFDKRYVSKHYRNFKSP